MARKTKNATSIVEHKTKKMKVSDLVGWDRNPREITEEALQGLSKSISEFGLVQPIIWNEQTNRVVGGHQRLQVLVANGVEKTNVTVVDLTPEREKVLNVALNNPEIAGTFSSDIKELLKEIEDDDVELFDDLEMGSLLNSLIDEDEEKKEIIQDEIPEEVESRTKTGDLWILGDHRLLCGDSMKREDVERVMGGERADLCFTDPPYGAEIQYDTHSDTQDALVGLIAGFFPLAQKHSRLVALTPGIGNLWHYKRPDWVLCWFYAAGIGSTPWGFSAWQPVLVWGKDPKLVGGEGRHPDGFSWPMSREDAEDRKVLDHTCPKPVSSWAKWIGRLSNKKTSLVFDPFMGSGTTIMAAEQSGLRCFGLEISPKYCDVIVARWEQFTGKKAKLSK